MVLKCKLIGTIGRLQSILYEVTNTDTFPLLRWGVLPSYASLPPAPQSHSEKRPGPRRLGGPRKTLSFLVLHSLEW